MNFSDALGYPLRDKNAAKKLLVGGINILLSFLIIPFMLNLGFAVAIGQLLAQGEDDRMPNWSDWNTHLKNGGLILVQQFLNSLMLYLPFLITFILLATISNLGEGTTVQTIADSVGIILFLVFIFINFFIFPVTFVLFILNTVVQLGGNISGFRQLLSLLRDYFFDVLQIFIFTAFMTAIFGSIQTTLFFIPCVGQILAFVIPPIWSFYLFGVNAHLGAQMALKSMHKIG